MESCEDEYLLSWSEHHTNFFSLMSEMVLEQQLTDVSLWAGQTLYSAHRLVLALSSSYFRLVLAEGHGKHPVIFLKDVNSRDMERLLQYMYCGEVSVPQDELVSLITAAKSLGVKGLADSGNKGIKPSRGKVEERLFGGGRNKRGESGEEKERVAKKPRMGGEDGEVKVARLGKTVESKSVFKVGMKVTRVSGKVVDKVEKASQGENSRGETGTRERVALGRLEEADVKIENKKIEENIREEREEREEKREDTVINAKKDIPLEEEKHYSTLHNKNSPSGEEINYSALRNKNSPDNEDRSNSSSRKKVSPGVEDRPYSSFLEVNVKQEEYSPPDVQIHPILGQETPDNDYLMSVSSPLSRVTLPSLVRPTPSLLSSSSTSSGAPAGVAHPGDRRNTGTCHFCGRSFMKNKQLMNHVCPMRPPPGK